MSNEAEEQKQSDELLEAIEEWTAHYMKQTKPVALTLMRAKAKIVAQRSRIEELWDALERQNKEVDRLNGILENAHQTV